MPANKLPSKYRGIFMDTMLNEDMNIQNQERSRNAGEGSRREFVVVLDNDGQDIDLNFPPANF